MYTKTLKESTFDPGRGVDISFTLSPSALVNAVRVLSTKSFMSYVFIL